MRGLLIIGLLALATDAFAQDLPPATQQQLENLGDENLEDDALLQTLEFYQHRPLNLNTATIEELQALKLLNQLQITSFLSYRNLFGKLVDKYELQAVPGFDALTFKKIQPYVFVGPALTVTETLRARLKGGEQYVLGRLSRTLEKGKGYDTSLSTHYSGDRNRLLLRYRYQYKNLLQYGLVADKDAGEQFLKGAQKLGFDFYSAHLFIRRLGKIKALALGDYVVNLGQGLTQWQSLSFGKSSEVMGINRQSAVLLPYRSAGEFNFNRGAAATIQLKAWELTGFLSFKKFSGNLVADSVTRFTSFGTSGYYRTASEVADRYKLSDFSYGGNISYSKPAFKIGLNAVMHQFSAPLQKSNEPYNFYSLSGRQAFNASADYNYLYHNIYLFGEAAVDKAGNTAVVQGALVSADAKVDLSFLYRRLSAAYQAPFGNAFTESTLPGNEEGLYTGLIIKPDVAWQLCAYADFYRFPFLKYRTNAPTAGTDYLAQVNYTPNKATDLYLRYRTETKPVNESGATWVINFPVDKAKQSLRLNYSTQLSKALFVKSRVELLWFDKRGNSPEEGFLFFTEGAYQYNSRLQGNLRLQYFETGGYNSRIYTYESDVLYSFSIPAFYDKGFRYYLNASYEFTGKLKLWLRFGQTLYKDKNNIGSGLDEIAGNHRSELKLQARYSF